MCPDIRETIWGGRDVLYVDGVKEFAGDSLSDFKASLTATEDAGGKVVSMMERDYDYAAFMTTIKVLKDLFPRLKKEQLPCCSRYNAS